MRAVSHIAIGVSDLDKSLHFYVDLLGLKLCLDTMEDVGGGGPPLFTESSSPERRAAYLRFDEGPHASFLVMSQHAGQQSGGALKLDQVGIHHFAFWVDDLRKRVKRLEAGGVKMILPPSESDTIGYGEPAGGRILTCFFQDPDGIIVQLDQRLPEQ